MWKGESVILITFHLSLCTFGQHLFKIEQCLRTDYCNRIINLKKLEKKPLKIIFLKIKNLNNKGKNSNKFVEEEKLHNLKSNSNDN